MAEKETKNQPKDLIEAVPEEVAKLEQQQAQHDEEPQRRLSREERKAQMEAENEKRALESWIPKTALGRAVREGKETDIDSVLASGKRVLEQQVFDSLLRLESDVLLVGQSKGKFGGGKRRAWRQTQRKTMEGNIVTFSCMAVVGDKKGHIGLGYGKAKETLPARAKAIRKAKLNIIKIRRGFETRESSMSEPHTVPFIVNGKCSSVRIKLIPAPRGTGLVVGDECKKILRLAGIKDIYGVSKGQTRTTFNLAKACIDALRKTTEMDL